MGSRVQPRSLTQRHRVWCCSSSRGRSEAREHVPRHPQCHSSCPGREGRGLSDLGAQKERTSTQFGVPFDRTELSERLLPEHPLPGVSLLVVTKDRQKHHPRGAKPAPTQPGGPPTPHPPCPPCPPSRGGWSGTAARSELLAAVDCAVGSGEWAEPPHSPWTLRHRGPKRAIFCPFSGSEDSAKGALFGPFLAHFWPIFGPFWALFWPFWGPFLALFWPLLALYPSWPPARRNAIGCGLALPACWPHPSWPSDGQVGHGKLAGDRP